MALLSDEKLDEIIKDIQLGGYPPMLGYDITSDQFRRIRNTLIPLTTIDNLDEVTEYKRDWANKINYRQVNNGKI